MNIIKKILSENLTIESENLTIYPFILTPKIIIDLFEIYSDFENIYGYAAQHSDIMKFTEYMRDKINYHQNEIFGYISYLIEYKKSRKIIGLRNILLDGAYTYDGNRKDNNENVISEMIINKHFWNRGYGREASTLIFELLKRYNIKNVITIINKGNINGFLLDKL